MFEKFEAIRRRGSGRRSALAATMAAAALLPAAAASQQSPSTPPAAAEPQVRVAVPSVGVNLNITPRRLTFDPKTRTATVYIFNQGTTPATFDIALIDRVMLPSGDIRPHAEATASPEWKPVADKLQSAQALVIAAPRRATLAPGKGQTIRIRANQPPNGSGEYRTHLTVSTIPPRTTGLTAEQAASQQPGELSFQIQSVFGLSIPIIVRPGALDVKADIANVSLAYADISPDGVAPARRTPVVSFDLRRSGANSLFGNIEIRSASGREPLGIARGVGVYPEIDGRSIRIPLQRAPKSGEQLSIVFTDDDAKPGDVLARSSFTAS